MFLVFSISKYHWILLRLASTNNSEYVFLTCRI